MKNQVIGIDISKDTLDYCTLKTDTVDVEEKDMVYNEKNAINKWLKYLDSSKVVFALEHTGHYGTALVNCLSENGFVFYLINPLDLKRSLGIQRGKTDVKDAYRIAEYAIVNKHKLKPYQLPGEHLNKLKALLTARERFVKISVQIQNSLKANEILNESIDLLYP